MKKYLFIIVLLGSFVLASAQEVVLPNIFVKMDINKDKQVSMSEMTNWFGKLDTANAGKVNIASVPDVDSASLKILCLMDADKDSTVTLKGALVWLNRKDIDKDKNVDIDELMDTRTDLEELKPIIINGTNVVKKIKFVPIDPASVPEW